MIIESDFSMRETKTLDMDSISKEENRSEEKGIQDVEEGEISDAASVEEISEGDFKKQETKIVKESNSSTNSKLTKPESRVWTMSDLFKYQMKGGYVSGLSNLAWAQAVQNKPLTEIFAETEAKRPDLLDASGKDGGVVDGDGGELADGEKEEGELEEGEIDLDTNTVGKLNGEDKIDSNALATNSNSNAAAKNLNLIRGVLESVNGVEVEQSFETICTNVGDAIGRLRELVRENSTLNLNSDGVSRSLYIVVQRIILAYGCMSDDLKKQKKEIFSRLTGTMNNIGPHIFSPEQAKGIEVMISSVDFPDSLVNAKDQENKPGDNLLSTDVEYNKSCISLETPKVGVPSFRSRANLLRPLIDLHKDHDEDSLPSPTRETTTTFPVHRVLMAGEGANPGFPTLKPVPSVQDPRTQFYANDALKAVSSYQQKFGRNSFFMTDRLPSPTPSEESGDGEGDTGGEVSSSSTINNLKSVNPSFTIQQVVSPPPVPESQSLPAITPVNPPVSAGPAVSRPAVKSSAKSRDPRLRYVNSDVNRVDQSQHSLPIVNSVPFGQINNPKKQKNAEDTSIDGPAMKKQRNSLENVGGLREGIAVTRSGLLLEDIDMVGPQIKNSNQAKMDSDPRNLQNGDTGRVLSISQERIPVTGTNTTTKVEQFALTGTGPTSIPDLLKVLAVNPALLNNPALMNNSVLLNILKMGQQSLALDTLPKTADSATINGQLPSVNPVIGSGPMLNVVASQSQGILPKAAPPQFPSQVSASDERGKIRMKPRDPRRALHNTAIQRNGSLGSDQLKANINPTSADQGIKENQIVQKQEGQTETKQALKSVTESEITSAPQVSAAPSTTQNTTVSVSLNSDRESGTCTSVDVTAAAARSPNGWADVEHLFQNYDDQQKAAIQRERARRMDEQKKMFAQRKLCLVLDLDHTLLNSAKFVEVDPVHDEILRKKEEQDREKLFRHLFRFPHMGMWTKLRPGIWNFLEKASQLYELHLYTMGNKLYATEMAKLLDPKGTLFAGRVISRGDDGDTLDSDDRVPKSKDLEGVLGMESSVVIMDDSVRVWPHNKLNLIVVERYIYFPCSRRQFGLPGPSLLEIDHDERPEDGTLASSLAVIQKIHQNFFTHLSLDEADVRSILATEQRKILDGCRIVFSRVFPVDEVKPHLHPLWLTAEQFGAVCTNQIDDQVTHVVANSLGTDKVNWALSKGRHVVYPGWVEASALLYRRANERDFAVK